MKRRRTGAAVLWLLAVGMMLSVLESLILPTGAYYQRMMGKMRLEEAATELMQDIYLVQTQNYGYGAEKPVLRVGQHANYYSVDGGDQGRYTKHFEKIHFVSTPMNFLFHKDGSPYAGGNIIVSEEEGGVSWTITVLPVTGRVSVNRM